MDDLGHVCQAGAFYSKWIVMLSAMPGAPLSVVVDECAWHQYRGG
eukprot:CAMPEP_0183557934 /NCGR_PEP_ID=MMETSP0371-20130417/87028_1 /TAXON_ID=268820 /ORGANISM="Peridinium aciculiferum, Strain PAER-2" /LENGTH=44 /DNA_ID= /DNA_START= /DNA_END= /DNA_ORIENTATION=